MHLVKFANETCYRTEISYFLTRHPTQCVVYNRGKYRSPNHPGRRPSVDRATYGRTAVEPDTHMNTTNIIMVLCPPKESIWFGIGQRIEEGMQGCQAYD